MNRAGTDQAGKTTHEFQEIKAGRRVVLEFPVFSSTCRCKLVSTVVLDSARVASGNSAECSCAALIVPRSGKKEWVYSSEGGQWQLLASAGVSRLIVLFPKLDPVKHVGLQNRLGKLSAQVSEDEELKTTFRPLVLALSPKVLFRYGIPDIPFLHYTDHVARRVEVEMAYSSLTGLMMVEDVELKPESEHEEESCVCVISPQSPGTEQQSSEVLTSGAKSIETWRRRLIFERMPNLIQTEVPLIACPTQNLDKCKRSSARERQRGKGSYSRTRKDFHETQAGVKRTVVDHSRLVHKYLPPVIAGFVLISPCLDECVRSQLKPKVLCIGVGGGALPTFLHNQFGFHIQAIDLDEVVLDLARRHFGLEEGPNFEVVAGDGLDAVTRIAARAVAIGLVDNRLRTKWRNSLSDHEPYENPPAPDSPAEVAFMQESVCTSEQNLSLGEKVLLTQDGKVVNVGVTDYECPSGSTDDNARDANVANEAAANVASRCSKLNMVSHSSLSLKGEMDPRVDMIIVDVDVNDARSELSSPPAAFIKPKFLTAAHVALKEGGMLVMNVIPSGRKAYEDVLESLASIFEEVYEIILQSEVYHCVLFALPGPACSASLVGPTEDLVRRFGYGRLIQRIRNLKCSSASFSVRLHE